jgi:hypothetical protein
MMVAFVIESSLIFIAKFYRNQRHGPYPLSCRNLDQNMRNIFLICSRSEYNQPNRRVRTRMHGGVGGAEPRGAPLSRFTTP